MTGTDIIELTEPREDVLARINELVGQLTGHPGTLDPEGLREITASAAGRLFLIRCDGRVAGMFTLGRYRTPTGVKYWVEDVVVDRAFRGRALGRRLMDYAVDYVRRAEPSATLMLTSNPSRVAANHLYRAVGFTPKETNVYRMTFAD